MPSKTGNRTRGARPAAPVATGAPPRRAAAVTPAPGAPWATIEEIAWAEAHGLDLSREVQAEHAAGVRIAASLIDQARQRRLRAIDRVIAQRSDWLSGLHRRGQRAAERSQQERYEHRLSVERHRDAALPWQRWRPVCACGWSGPALTTREAAERRAREEREHIFRPLSEAVEHTSDGARREVA
jgi:hypothetical protein